MIKVFIEVDAGSNEKHSYDEKSLQHLHRSYTLEPYPYPYGFIRGTLTDDGEALDAYIITSRHYSPGTEVECEAVGLLELFEDSELDHKVIALLPDDSGNTVNPGDTPQNEAPADKFPLNEALREELEDFILAIFKKFPKINVRIGRLLPRNSALAHIEMCRIK